jgi:hypothetical protein
MELFLELAKNIPDVEMLLALEPEELAASFCSYGKATRHKNLFKRTALIRGVGSTGIQLTQPIHRIDGQK